MREEIIFYPGPIHLLWSTGIYYVNELSKSYDVTLVLENAASEDINRINDLTENRIVKIYMVGLFYMIKRHENYKNIFKKIFKKNNFKYAFAPDDMHPLNIYLFRQAKKCGCVNICYQSGFMVGERREQRIMMNSEKALFIKYKYGVPFTFASILIDIVNTVRHWWHYMIAPLVVGEQPFWGKSSCFTHKGHSTMRDGDHYILYGERERSIFIKGGVEPKETIVIPHPITWDCNIRFNNKLLNCRSVELSDCESIIIFLDDIQYTFNKELRRVITRDDFCKSWIKVIEILSQKFPQSTIWLKPHPAQSDELNISEMFKTVVTQSDNVKIVNQFENAMDFFSTCGVIISQNSTVLFLASLLFDNKTIISLNLHDRYLGDVYKKVNNIHYFPNLRDFENYDFKSNKKVQLQRWDGSKLMKDFLFSIADRRVRNS
ncbi:MAG: hypothetical protein KKH94_06000 [Candidatus Omnitrophica bacterium]|nr:hypothetical protein [Candidatus Omnitrophota bacterium]